MPGKVLFIRCRFYLDFANPPPSFWNLIFHETLKRVMVNSIPGPRRLILILEYQGNQGESLPGLFPNICLILPRHFRYYHPQESLHYHLILRIVYT